MIDLNALDLNDPKVYRMIAEGKNLGLFQINKPWVRGILRDIAPDRFEDLVAIGALLRPGALDNGFPAQYAARKRSGDTIPDIHPEIDSRLEEVLKDSYGLAIYQENALAIISEVTGWGYAKSDVLFNAFRKKDLDKLHGARPNFFAASRYSEDCTETVWELLEPFGDYSFGKAHSAAYAYTTYWTAWLKFYYPAEFISAMLTNVDGKDAKQKLENTIALIKEARAEGIAVLPPSINLSEAGFTPTKRGIRYGLEGIRDIGTSVVDGITKGRPYSGIDDFLQRAPGACLSAKTLPALLWSGALGAEAVPSAEYLKSLERSARLVLEHRRRANELGDKPLVPISYEPVGDFRCNYALAGKQEAYYLGMRIQ